MSTYKPLQHADGSAPAEPAHPATTDGIYQAAVAYYLAEQDPGNGHSVLAALWTDYLAALAKYSITTGRAS